MNFVPAPTGQQPQHAKPPGPSISAQEGMPTTRCRDLFQPVEDDDPKLAQSRHAQCADECPLLGAKRTWTNRRLPNSIYEYTA